MVVIPIWAAKVDRVEDDGFCHYYLPECPWCLLDSRKARRDLAGFGREKELLPPTISMWVGCNHVCLPWIDGVLRLIGRHRDEDGDAMVIRLR
ncbi:hypothetical protein ACLOJK_034410 [Asimina triloba]